MFRTVNSGNLGQNNCKHPQIKYRQADNLMVAISRPWYNGSYTIAAKPIKSLELHYTMIQFLISNDNIYSPFPALAPNSLQIQFSGGFSNGDFVEISVSTRPAQGTKESTMPLQDEENDTNTQEQTPKLFACPIDGCVKCFQQYGSLENHLQYGSCKLVPERENLFDNAKISYRDKLLHGCDRHPVLASSTLPVLAGDIKSQGWALKMTKKATRFNEKQKKYLEEKFLLGQETGHKAEAVTVAQEMRYARDEGGNRRFTIDEFLTPQQVTSFFSRMAAKLKNKHEEIVEEDTTAAEDQAAYSSTRTNILENCQLMHPIVYDSFNLCSLNASTGFKRLSVNMLRMMCEYFDLDIANIPRSRKAPYMQLLSNLVQTCSCVSSGH